MSQMRYKLFDVETDPNSAFLSREGGIEIFEKLVDDENEPWTFEYYLQVELDLHICLIWLVSYDIFGIWIQSLFKFGKLRGRG